MRFRNLLVCAALGTALVSVGAGCSSDSADTQQPEAVATPHFVSDLSALSSKPINPILDPNAAFAATHVGDDAGSGRADEAAPGTTRNVGTDENPGVEQLLNPKAAQFASFTGLLLQHLWVAVHKAEKHNRIARLRLPRDLRASIIVATLDSHGTLKEIVLEQHCGEGVIDRMFIDAAKKALWATNPPSEAAMPDGNYRVRAVLRMHNFASMDEKTWRFKTYIGMALL